MNTYLAEPLKAVVAVVYRRDVSEHYELLISPAGSEIRARLRSPFVGETDCRLPSWPQRTQEPPALRMVHSLVECFFGDVHAVPRIVGAPDWARVTLQVMLLRNEVSQPLLTVELHAENATRGHMARSLHGGRLSPLEPLRLCPEDADPLYAVTRLAVSAAVQPLVVVPAETPADVPVPAEATA